MKAHEVTQVMSLEFTRPLQLLKNDTLGILVANPSYICQSVRF